MSMNQFLAEYYGTAEDTASQHSAEDTEKQAQVELFAKLAAENGIDLSQASPEQIEYAWQEFQKAASEGALEEQKVASEEPKSEEKKKDDGDEDDRKKKLEQAAEEHEEKKAAAEKFAEADYLGRVMAHAYVDELKKIASATQAAPETPAVEDEKTASLKDKAMAAAAKAKGVGKEYVKGLKGEGLKDNFKRMMHERGASIHGELAAKERLTHAAKRTGAAYGATAAAAGAAGATAHHALKKEKKASALDELALESAVIKAAEAGWDVDEAATRLVGYLELDVSEATKIASAADLGTAIEMRSLELLEGAGYPVTWNQ